MTAVFNNCIPKKGCHSTLPGSSTTMSTFNFRYTWYTICFQPSVAIADGQQMDIRWNQNEGDTQRRVVKWCWRINCNCSSCFQRCLGWAGFSQQLVCMMSDSHSFMRPNDWFALFAKRSLSTLYFYHFFHKHKLTKLENEKKWVEAASCKAATKKARRTQCISLFTHVQQCYVFI